MLICSQQLRVHLIRLDFLSGMAVTKYFVIFGLLCFFTDGKKCPTDCHCYDDEIDCSRNQLLEIPTEIPETARTLKMNFNQVSTLDAKITLPLRNLRNLELHSNALHDIKPVTFVAMNNLEKLVISKNSLKSLPKKTFFQMRNLKTLLLNENLLETIDGAISDLRSLEMLDLSRNRLTQLTAKAFVNLPKLRNLKLGHNDIVSIAMDTFTSLTSMIMLDLGNNPLRSLDGVLSSDSNLSLLGIKKCQLSTFPSGLPRSVQFIDASENNLTRIGKEELHLNVVILTLSDNKISEVEEGAFSQLDKLSKLELQNNYLTEIPQISSTVHHLNIQSNMINHMETDSFPQNSQLEELFLQRNLISNITQNVFRNIPLLTKLSIGENLIQNLSSRLFYNVPNLSHLNINKIHIEKISESVFDNLKTLQTLSMSGITSTPNSIQGNFLQPLLDLQSLNLRNSPSVAKYLLESKEMQRSLGYLSELNLMSNNITTLASQIMGSLPRIETLNISDNNFHCDQRLVWFGQWIKLGSSQFSEPDKIVCYTPRELQGRPIYQMENSDFVPTTTSPSNKHITVNIATFKPSRKPLGPDSMSDEQTSSASSTNSQFIALTISVSVFIILVAVAFVVFHVCRQSRGLVYNRSTIINHPPPVNFFISNEENAPVPPPPKLSRQDRSSVTSQTSKDITSEEQGVKVYTWSG